MPTLPLARCLSKSLKRPMPQFPCWALGIWESHWGQVVSMAPVTEQMLHSKVPVFVKVTKETRYSVTKHRSQDPCTEQGGEDPRAVSRPSTVTRRRRLSHFQWRNTPTSSRDSLSKPCPPLAIKHSKAETPGFLYVIYRQGGLVKVHRGPLSLSSKWHLSARRERSLAVCWIISEQNEPKSTRGREWGMRGKLIIPYKFNLHSPLHFNSIYMSFPKSSVIWNPPTW